MLTRIGIANVNTAVRTLATKSIHGYYSLAQPFHQGWLAFEGLENQDFGRVSLHHDKVIIIAGDKNQILENYTIVGPSILSFSDGKTVVDEDDSPYCVTVFHQRRLFRDNYWAVVLSAADLRFGQPVKRGGQRNHIYVASKDQVLKLLRETFAGRGLNRLLKYPSPIRPAPVT